jgi:predicted PurR-regulated permease PerM
MAVSKPIPPFYTKLAMVLVSVIALFYIAILGKAIVAPMLFALLFSMLLLPVASFLEKKLGFHRSLAAGLSVFLLVLSVAAIFYVVFTQISNLAQDWPQFKSHFLSSLKEFQQWISRKFNVNLTKQNNYVNNTAVQILGSGPAMIGDTLISLSTVILFMIFTMLDTFFLLYYRRLLIKFLVSVFKEENSEMVYAIIAQVQSRIRQYIQGLLLEMAIVSSVCCLILWIMGVDYAVLLGLLCGLLNLIPYIGIWISIIFSTLVTFATAGVGKILLVITTLFGIHLMDANLLLPVIVGGKVRLNALITISGVIIGGKVWGVIGAFLAIPVIAIIKIIFDKIESLQPWGMLLGDERDEKHPEPLSKEIKEETH